jgi:AAA+ superfamily predicted ATPase
MPEYSVVQTTVNIPSLPFHIELSVYDKIRNFPFIPLHVYIKIKFENAVLLKRPIFILNIEDLFPRENEANESAALELNRWLARKMVKVDSFSRNIDLVNQNILSYFRKYDGVKTSRNPKDDFAWAINPTKGQEAVKMKLEFLFSKLRDPTYTDLPPIKGVLLYGQPGTGKTFIAYTLCKNFGLHVENLSIPEIIHAEIGSSEKSIHSAFERAIEFQPSVVFIDELEAAFKRQDRCEIGSVDSRILSQIILEFDRIGKNRVIVFGITNLIDSLDDRLFLSGRFEVKLQIQLPDFNFRLQILTEFLSSDLKSEEIESIAKQTSGFTPADLQNLIDTSRRISLKRELFKISSKSLFSIILENLMSRIPIST